MPMLSFTDLVKEKIMPGSVERTKEELCRFFKETLQDSKTGKYSHAKVIAMAGFLALTIFVWKIILTGTLTIEFFLAYAAYCTGHQTINKFLDTKKGKE